MAHGISDDDSTKIEHVDPPGVLEKKLEQLADWIRNAKHFIVFTGYSLLNTYAIYILFQ